MRIAVALAFATIGSSAAASPKNPADFDWNSITPSWDLEYIRCYDDLECARLLMPLDWLQEDEQKRRNQTVAIALIKQPAVVPASHQQYGGSILTNPGGPGDSGVVHILKNGVYLRNMMDSDTRHYEIISFDPRGMGFTTPSADCYGSELARNLADAQSNGLGFPNINSDANLAQHIAADAALSMQCALTSQRANGFAIQEYMSTASVARDMVQMIDKIDELLHQIKKTDSNSGSGSSSGAQKPLNAIGGKQYRPKTTTKPKARLQFYGTSYGTYLGQTFLSMFPDRVHRMVLDGVVVSEDSNANDWSPNLEDTTKVIDYFYQTCFEASEGKCALKTSTDKSWKDIKAKVEAAIAKLDANPLPFAAVDGVPSVVVGAMMRGLMMDPIYNPLELYSGLANTWADAVNGNYTSLLSSLGASTVSSECGASTPAQYKWMGLANMAVRCGDADDVRDQDLKYWKSYIGKCVKNSPELGTAWAGLICSGWTVRPKYRLTGPFTSPVADSGQIDGHPSAPVLFLSNRLDPVTPLRSAHTAAKSHPGSTVLVQNTVAHCTLLGSPSKCTFGHLRKYMETGQLPKDGTICEGDCAPWQPCPFPRAQLPR